MSLMQGEEVFICVLSCSAVLSLFVPKDSLLNAQEERPALECPSQRRTTGEVRAPSAHRGSPALWWRQVLWGVELYNVKPPLSLP